MTLILEGTQRKLTVLSENSSDKLKQFSEWLNNYPHFNKQEKNNYYFDKDTYVVSAYMKAKKMGLLVNYS